METAEAGVISSIVFGTISLIFAISAGALT